MKLARLQVNEMAAPVLALLRDGAFYDVAVLEEMWRLRPTDRGVGSFHARVVASRLNGLEQLDTRLACGQRPTEARLPNAEVLPLPPCAPERGDLLLMSPLLSTGPLRVERRCRRALLGDGHPVLYPTAVSRLRVEVGLAAVLADDLTRASERQARAAVLGIAPLLDWSDAGAWHNPRWAPFPPAQLGPALLVGASMRAALKRSLRVRGGGKDVSLPATVDIPARLAALSRLLPLHAGDVVGLGCLPGGQLDWEYGELLSLSLRGLPPLRGWPLPPR